MAVTEGDLAFTAQRIEFTHESSKGGLNMTKTISLPRKILYDANDKAMVQVAMQGWRLESENNANNREDVEWGQGGVTISREGVDGPDVTVRVKADMGPQDPTAWKFSGWVDVLVIGLVKKAKGD
ncbi:hypothetical protein [Actinomadura gamaensis]|uniref:Uncharacterized protein n=1 Tax=Actinomadura gamaensis TaxID=1763541 RepID=A0ABV9U2V0_9ACTN